MMKRQIIWGQWAYLDGTFQPHSGVYVKESKIVEVGSVDSLKQSYPEANVEGGNGYIMMPGLINSHDHGRALGTVSLGVPDSFLEVWLTSLGRVPRLSARLTATYEGIQLIRSGVTAVAHSHNPASYDVMFDEIPHTLQGYREAGVRVAMNPTLVDQNPLVYDEADKFLTSLPDDLRSLAKAQLQLPSFTVDDYFREIDALFEQSHDTDVPLGAYPNQSSWRAMGERRFYYARCGVGKGAQYPCSDAYAGKWLSTTICVPQMEQGFHPTFR